MSNTGNRILDGTQFKNVSIEFDDCMQQGNLEVADTIYVNKIEEYDINTGVTIEQSIFQGGTVIITSTQPSINKTTASLIVNGGAVIYEDSLLYGVSNFLNTSNSINLTSGSVIITGGTSIQKNLNVGGITTIFNTTTSDNSNIGSIILYGGLSINNTTDSTSFIQGGDLTIAGGASIAKTLFANILNSNTIFITNANLLNSNTINQTTTNLLVTNISTSTLNVIGSTITNSYINFNTVSNSYILNSNITFSSIANLEVSNGNIFSFNSTNGNIVGLTVANLNVTNEISYTEVITYSSTGNFINTFSTINSLQLTNGTFGSFYGNNIFSTNISTNSVLINGVIDSINSTTGTLILNYGGLSINNTSNATSFTSGGAETIAGGLAVGKNMYIGGFLDVNSNNIFNITAPSLDFNNTVASIGLVASNKWYVDTRFNQFTIGNISGNISQGQVIVGITGGNIGSYPTFTFDGNLLTLNSTIDATSLTNGGTLKVYGGVSINKQLFVGGNTYILGYLDMNNQKIMSLAIPTMPYDAANKYYVDNTIANGFTTSNINVTNLSSGTINANGVTFGNINFTGQLYQNSVPYVNSQWIGTTGTTLYYGNNNALVGIGTSNPSYTLDIRGTTNISGSLTSGALYSPLSTITNLVTTNISTNSVLINGVIDSINSTTGTLILNYGGLSINNTSNATSFTSGGAETIAGGLAVGKNMYIGGFLDVNSNNIFNITAPSLDFNNTVASIGLVASNKWYVDTRFNQFTIGNGNISGNISQGQVIVGITGGNIGSYPTFTFDNILGTVNINSTNNSLGLGSGGSLNINGGTSILGNVYIGSGLDLNNNLITNVSLPINPLDAVNKEYVDYYTGFNPGDIRERSFVLNNNVNTATDVTGFVFLNTQISSFEAIVYLQIPEINIYDQWEIHGLLKGNNWIINTPFIGDHPSKVTFTITNSGQIQYTNNNSSGTATIRFRAYTTSQGLYTNTTVSNNLRSVPFGGTGSDFFTLGTLLIGDNTSSIKTNLNLMYLNNTLLLNNTSNAVNLSTATAIFSGGISIQKNLLVGGGIDINMKKITNLDTPINPFDAANKFYVDSVFSSGGSLNLYGPVSFYSTNDASSVTNGGALTIYGGTSIAKQLYVGGITSFINTTISTSTTNGSVIISGGLGVNGNINSNFVDAFNIINTNITTSNIISQNLSSTNISVSNMFVNNVNMTPSSGDLFKEQSFNASDNVYTPDSITGFIFNNNVRYFTGWLSVFITASTNTVTAFTIEGIQVNSGVWIINQRFIGTNVKIKLSITNSGQIQYTCPTISGFVSSLMKFRAITTSV